MSVVILPAAGVGSRFGASTPKQFLLLAGIPIIVRTMLVFEQATSVRSIVVSAAPQYHKELRALALEFGISKLTAIVNGGSERQDSIRNALQTSIVQSEGVILVHDAVRPFITPEFVNRLVQSAMVDGAVIPGLEPKETVKEINASHCVHKTHDRNALRLIQTPQAFHSAVLFEAYQKAAEANFVGTDDASVVEFAGFPVRIEQGLEQNIKITTPMDWTLAELLLRTTAPAIEPIVE